MTAIATTPAVEQSGPAPGPAPGSGTGPGTGPRHLHAVDVVRVLMIAGVIAVHVVAYTTSPTDVTVGAVTALLHVNREVFFFLTAFVLTYTYAAREGWSLKRFWAKRYLFVGAPYLLWTLVYFLADGSQPGWRAALHALMADVVAGTARYHLYFLLVTMQIYAVFPLLLWLLRATRRHHGALLAGCLGFQLAFTALLHYGLHRPLLLRPWLDHPDQLLPSYLLYLVAGGIAALHLGEVTAWLRDHRRAVPFLVAGGVAAGVASYLVDHFVIGLDPPAAAEVFQPMVAVTSAAAIIGLSSLGVWWADRGAGRPFQRPVRVASDGTFGVYLAHPLILQGALLVAAPLVRSAVAGDLPSPVVLSVDLLFIVPLLFALTALAVWGARRTPASLALTGRPRRRAAGGHTAGAS